MAERISSEQAAANLAAAKADAAAWKAKQAEIESNFSPEEKAQLAAWRAGESDIGDLKDKVAAGPPETSQAPPNKPAAVGTRYTNSAITQEKARTLARKNPALGQFIANTFQVPLLTAKPPGEQQMDRYTRNVIQTLFSTEIKTEQKMSKTLQAASSDIKGLKKEAVHEIQGVKETLSELLKPISSATGATLGVINNVAENPLGAPFVLGGAMSSLVDKVNPDFANKLDSSFKKFKTDELMNAPAQVAGSIRNLAAQADDLLAVPFGMASDLYNGLIDITEEISGLLDGVVSAATDMFLGPGGVVDAVLPVDQVNMLMDSLGGLSDSISSITNGVGGFDLVSDLSSQLGDFSSQAKLILADPTSLVNQYIPQDVSANLDALRNPKQLLDNMIPKSISTQFQQIANAPGLGFVGNLGYGIGGTLDSLSKGVLEDTFNAYTQQLGILQPQSNRSSTKDPVSNLKTPHPPQITTATTNPNIPTVHGVPVQTTPPPEVQPTKKNASPSQTISSGDQPGTLLNSFSPGDKTFLDQLKSGKSF
jgi:hypothetical protein